MGNEYEKKLDELYDSQQKVDVVPFLISEGHEFSKANPRDAEVIGAIKSGYADVKSLQRLEKNFSKWISKDVENKPVGPPPASMA